MQKTALETLHEKSPELLPQQGISEYKIIFVNTNDSREREKQRCIFFSEKHDTQYLCFSADS